MPETEKPAGPVSNAGFAAWGLYGVLMVLGYAAAAVCAGFVIMLALVTHEYRSRTVKIIDCTSLGFFTLALPTIVIPGRDFRDYRIVAAWGIFALVAWATLITGFPFTLQYARERVPHEIWNRPEFLRLNVIMTVVWALIFTLDTILTAIALAGRYVLLLDAIIPTITLVLGYAFNHFYPEHFRKRFSTPPAKCGAALS